jgi:hypothetical protein
MYRPNATMPYPAPTTPGPDGNKKEPRGDETGDQQM